MPDSSGIFPLKLSLIRMTSILIGLIADFCLAWYSHSKFIVLPVLLLDPIYLKERCCSSLMFSPLLTLWGELNIGFNMSRLSWQAQSFITTSLGHGFLGRTKARRRISKRRCFKTAIDRVRQKLPCLRVPRLKLSTIIWFSWKPMSNQFFKSTYRWPGN